MQVSCPCVCCSQAHNTAESGRPWLRKLVRVWLAAVVHLPYALERALLQQLLRQPVFEPATPAQLAAVSVIWGSVGGSPAAARPAAATITAVLLNSTVGSHAGEHELGSDSWPVSRDAVCVSGIRWAVSRTASSCQATPRRQMLMLLITIISALVN